jgi:hypothetical protein
MRHQLAHRHRMVRRDLRDRAGLRIHFRDLEVRELGNVLRHRIVELPLPFLEQHHHRHAGDRLRHRVDAEDRVLLHRRGALQVALAGGFELHDLAVPRHHRHDAGQLVLVDQRLHLALQPAEPLRRHADAFGSGARKVGGECAAGEQDEQQAVENVARQLHESPVFSRSRWPGAKVYTTATIQL